MVTAGIIAEYNPFHNGHIYHIRETKKLTGADCIIVLMSGNFVQRGAPAICDKHLRAKAALLNGADLVLELPVSFATGSAEIFARGAVEILNGLGVIDFLSFGGESSDLSALSATAHAMTTETPGYKKILKDQLSQGKNFAAARAEALSAEGIPAPASANDILAIEYLKALEQTNSLIRPVLINRTGLDYNDTYRAGHPVLRDVCPSASYIRSLLFSETDPWRISSFLSAGLPESMHEPLMKLYRENALICEDDFSLLLHHKLLFSSEKELLKHPGITPDLARRLKNHQYEFLSFSSFADQIKTKNYTHSRIRRALTEILLDLDSPSMPDKIRVLGCRKKALFLLSEIQKKGTIPLVTSLAKEECFWQSDTMYEMILASKKGISMIPEPKKGIKIPD